MRQLVESKRFNFNPDQTHQNFKLQYNVIESADSLLKYGFSKPKLTTFFSVEHTDEKSSNISNDFEF